MLKIEKINLSELVQLRDAVEYLSEKTAQELTDYAVMYKDAYFNDIPEDLKPKYEKRKKLVQFSKLINGEIEKRIYEYME